MDREAWPTAVHAVAKSLIQLSDWTEMNWTELKAEALMKWALTLLQVKISLIFIFFIACECEIFQ